MKEARSCRDGSALAVPFVGLTTDCVVIAERLCQLHGGQALQRASLPMLAMDDGEIVLTEAPP